MARAHPRTNRDTADDDDADYDNVSGDGDKRDDKHDDDHDDDGGSEGDDSDEDDDDTVFRLRFVCCSRLGAQRAFIDLGGAAPRKKNVAA